MNLSEKQLRYLLEVIEADMEDAEMTADMEFRGFLGDLHIQMQAALYDKVNEPKNCPRCKQIYTGFPALSRLDNKSRICSPCGMDEAMQNFAGEPLTNFLKEE